MAKTFAYIRVSTREQNENRQLDSLQGLNIDEIIVEKASGKNFVGREKYQEMENLLCSVDTDNSSTGDIADNDISD